MRGVVCTSFLSCCCPSPYVNLPQACKMGFLDDILGPIKGVINDVENAVDEAVNLFGEVARFLMDVINTIKDVIRQISQLFNERKIEYMFIHPFKEAAFRALSDIKELVSLAVKAGGSGVELITEIADEAEYSIRAVIVKVKDGLTTFEDVTSRLIHDIKEEIRNIDFDISTSFAKLHSEIGSIPSYLDDFGSAVMNMFTVNTKKAYRTPIEFSNSLESRSIEPKHSITRAGTISYQPLDEFEKAMKARVKAESDALDIIVLVVVGLVFGAIIGVYMITNSVSTTVYVIVLLVIILAITFVVELVGN